MKEAHKKNFSLSLFELLTLTASVGTSCENAEQFHPDELHKRRFFHPKDLEYAGPDELAFFFLRVFESALKETQAGLLVVGQPFLAHIRQQYPRIWKNSIIVSTKEPYQALAILSRIYAFETRSAEDPEVPKHKHTFVHPTAVLAEGVSLSSGVQVGPHVVIEEGVMIGSDVQLHAGVYIGKACRIGQASVLFPRVVLYAGCELGARVRVHAGSVLGSDGFGFVPVRQEGRPVGQKKIYHLGGVRIGDDVEIGALCTLDRGTFGMTEIRSYAKLDDQVHLGHNSLVEEGAVICAGTCLAGHARVGPFASVGGLVGITNHVQVGREARVGANSLLSKDVSPGETALGNPQRTHEEHFKAHAFLNRALRKRKEN